MATDLEAKPTLHEIAAMPFSRTADAIRKHYDPAWGKNGEDGEPIKAWRVRFEWTVSGDFDEVIEAATEEEALEEAEEWVRDDYFSGHFEIDSSKVTPAKVKGASA